MDDLRIGLADQDAQLSGHGPLLNLRQFAEQGMVLDRDSDVLEARLFFLCHSALRGLLC